MRVVYMGTPAFACAPLMALNESKHEVLAVVTGRDARRGRRGDPCPTDVCCAAHDLDLPVFTPKTLKSKKLHQQLTELEPDLLVVIAFRILPPTLFNLPRLGAINIHGSLLPKYRGAAPINWALINGETETGLTSFLLNDRVDTGDMILQRSTAIVPHDNFDSVYARLSEMSGPFLLDTLDRVQDPGFEPIKQDSSVASPAPKLTLDDAMIDFGFPAPRVHDFVRGMSSKPGAYTFFRGRKLKVLKAQVADVTGKSGIRPGTILTDRKRLLVACAASVIELLEIVPEGKKSMNGGSFLNGLRPEPHEIFGDTERR